MRAMGDWVVVIFCVRAGWLGENLAYYDVLSHIFFCHYVINGERRRWFWVMHRASDYIRSRVCKPYLGVLQKALSVNRSFLISF